MFSNGLGDLGCVNLREDLEVISTWPPQPQPLGLEWRLLERGTWRGINFRHFEGTFRTPCVERVYNALPPESRQGRVQLVLPDGYSAGVVHLAATGDQGWGRRLRLGWPMMQQGVATMVLESPFYGARRPADQRGSKLRHVSDLLTLGWATIIESLHLLYWLGEEGCTTKGLCGLSMGGVHACMTAGLYPLDDLAVVPLLAPRSAAVAYIDGAMRPLMAWDALEVNADRVSAIVQSAAQAVSQLREASHALQVLEEVCAAQQRSLGQHEEGAVQNGSGDQKPASSGASTAAGSSSGSGGSGDSSASTSAQDASEQVEAALVELLLSQRQGRREQQRAFNHLRMVLETYTDVVRYPRPRRPDAAVIVAAESDAYVSTESVRQLHRYWEGSELRLVSGGHVSAFLLHQSSFRQAVLDSLQRLGTRPGQPPAGLASP